MKRPLAVFGLCFFLAMLLSTIFVGTEFSTKILLPLGIIPAVALCCLLFFGKKWRKSYVSLVLLALSVAFLYRWGFDALALGPIQELDGVESRVLARVEDVTPGYSDENVHAELRILEADAAELPRPILVQVKGMPSDGAYAASIGDLISLDISFYAVPQRQAANSFAKGYYIGATQKSALVYQGDSPTFLTSMRVLRYRAGDNIHEKLPLRLSSVAAAMSLGDKRYLDYDTVQAFRMAGLSHLLVVSGLHLSIFSAAIYAAGRALFRRKAVVSLLCIVAVGFFMAFTGFTPSIVRAGFACLLVYAAPLFHRKADIYTSLAFAAALLCLRNPYASVDLGLLLSFSATLGILMGNQLWAKMRWRHEEETNPAGIAKKTVYSVLQAAFLSLCAVLATLPVVIWSSNAVSLFTIPMNVLSTLLVTPLVLCGLFMAIPVAVLSTPAALIGGTLLVLLERMTDFCARFPSLYVYISGLFGFVVVVVIYGLLVCAYKTKYKRTYAISAILILISAIILHIALNTNTVRITVAGSGANASVVVTRQGQALVLYRGRLALNEIERILQTQNIQDCAVLIDMRRNIQSTEAVARLQPETVYLVAEELAGQEILAFDDTIQVYLKQQGEGTIACVDIQGYKVGINTGPVSLTDYATLDVLVNGASEATGEYLYFLTGDTVPDWVYSGATVLSGPEPPDIVIRPGISVIYRDHNNSFG